MALFQTSLISESLSASENNGFLSGLLGGFTRDDIPVAPGIVLEHRWFSVQGFIFTYGTIMPVVMVSLRLDYFATL